MQFRISHEVLLEITIDAASQKEAETIASAIPYEEWEQKYAVREDCVAIEESPVNPQYGG